MNWRPRIKKHYLDEPIEKVLDTLKTLDPSSEQYSRNVVFLERLTKLKAETRSRLKISPDTIIVAGANVLCVAIIVMAERTTPLNTKGFGFIKTKNP